MAKQSYTEEQAADFFEAIYTKRTNDALTMLAECPDLVHARTASNKVTPLHTAAERGCIEIADNLLRVGADVNAKSYWKQTPLHYAAEHGHKEIVGILLANRAEVNAKNYHKNTPLHLTTYEGIPLHLIAQSERLETVNTLVANGADLYAKNKEGRTPQDSAILYDNHAIIQALRLGRGTNPAAKVSHAQQHEERKAEASPYRGFGR